MENNNRQGCREDAIGFGLFILAGRYERFTDGIFGAWQGKEDRKLYSNDELYTLYKQQSIEPCATSSENFWTEEMILRFAELYRWSSGRITMKGFKESKDWQTADISVAKENAKQIDTGDRDLLPFEEGYVRKDGTGDQDCEELKKENDELRKEIDRLTKIIGKDIERHLSEKDLIIHDIEEQQTSIEPCATSSESFEQILREEFLVNTQNYPKEYHQLFHDKFNRAEKMYNEQQRLEGYIQEKDNAIGKLKSLIEKAFLRAYGLGYEAAAIGENPYPTECWRTFKSNNKL